MIKNTSNYWGGGGVGGRNKSIDNKPYDLYKENVCITTEYNRQSLSLRCQ